MLNLSNRIYSSEKKMENTNYSIRSLAAEIGKDPKNFTKSDIIKFIMDNDIRHVNFQYPAGDGRLKT